MKHIWKFLFSVTFSVVCAGWTASLAPIWWLWCTWRFGTATISDISSSSSMNSLAWWPRNRYVSGKINKLKNYNFLLEQIYSWYIKGMLIYYLKFFFHRFQRFYMKSRNRAWIMKLSKGILKRLLILEIWFLSMRALSQTKIIETSNAHLNDFSKFQYNAK